MYRAADPIVGSGVNTRVELAQAAPELRDRLLEEHMLAGVTIVDPATTWIEPDVVLEPDAVIHPFTVLRGRTSSAPAPRSARTWSRSTPRSARRATVGPFCVPPAGDRARGGRQGRRVRRGEELPHRGRTKVPHLSYIGDADVGEDTNIAAGAITANYRPERAAPSSEP